MAQPAGEPRRLLNLASRSLGASVIAANDESFGEKENLVVDAAANFTPGSYGHKGEIVDGWETRRRRPTPGYDWAVIRLGAAGVIRQLDVDTSFFTGNFPSECLVEACGLEGYPSLDDLNGPDTTWETLIPWSALKGDAHNHFTVTTGRRFTHVRLSIRPDGGVARLRVLGEALPDPRLFDGLTVDLAARELGGLVECSSDDFYSNAEVLTLPNLARTMGEGWETQRRRGPGNDWAVLRLAAPSSLVQVEVDTSYYVHNASGEFALWGCRAEQSPDPQSSAWKPLLPRTALRPDTRHRFRVPPAQQVTHLRFDVFPDGGVSRLRIFGHVAGESRRSLGVRWFNALPDGQAMTVLAETAGVSLTVAWELVAARPLPDAPHAAARLNEAFPNLGTAAADRLAELLDGS